MIRASLVGRMGAAALFAGAFAAAGCVDDNKQTVVLTRAVPLSTDMCEPDLEGDDFVSRGTFDAALGGQYFQQFEIENWITATSNASTGTTFPRGVRTFFYQGSQIQLRTPDSTKRATFESIPAELRNFTAPGFATIDPIRDNMISSVVMSVTLLSPTLVNNATFQSLASAGPLELIASVTAFGEVDDGSIETNTISFPLTVCSGCLRRVLGPCSTIDPSFNFASSCNLGADQVTDCCTAPDGSFICPGVGTKTM